MATAIPPRSQLSYLEFEIIAVAESQTNCNAIHFCAGQVIDREQMPSDISDFRAFFGFGDRQNTFFLWRQEVVQISVESDAGDFHQE